MQIKKRKGVVLTNWYANLGLYIHPCRRRRYVILNNAQNV